MTLKDPKALEAMIDRADLARTLAKEGQDFDSRPKADTVPGHEGLDPKIPLFQLLRWKAAIRLELLGMKHSSGRSVRKFAAEQLGMRPMAPASAVLSRIQALIDIGSWQR